METPIKSLRNRNVYKGDNFATPIKIPSSPFLEKLGYGTGVEVLRIKRSPRVGIEKSPWAVKRLARNLQPDQSKLYSGRLLEEASILRKLEHPNIVGFRAYKKINDGSECLAMENCDNCLGNLLEDRFEENSGPLPSVKIRTVCIDIAKALDYLHNEAHVLHGDIKSFNILIKNDFEICKLCDFGVSQPLDAEGFLDIVKKPEAYYVGTPIWSAPEVFEDDAAIISTKADIFSYGLVIYEMVSLVPPHTVNQDGSLITESENTGDEDMTDSSIVEPSYGTRPIISSQNELPEEYNVILELFYICTMMDYDERPEAKELVKNFQNIKF